MCQEMSNLRWSMIHLFLFVCLHNIINNQKILFKKMCFDDEIKEFLILHKPPGAGVGVKNLGCIDNLSIEGLMVRPGKCTLNIF